MADDIKRLEAKLDKIADIQLDQAKLLERNTVTLEEHVRRTNILESKLEPVEKHVTMVNGVFKALGIVATLVGIAGGMAKLMNKPLPPPQSVEMQKPQR